MDALLYQPIFFTIFGIISLLTASWYFSSSGNQLQMQKHNLLVPLVLSVILVFWLGNRPISGVAFGDTANYAFEYARLGTVGNVSINWRSEWIWALLMTTCKGAGLDVHTFFTIVEAGYVLSVFWAVKRFMPTNPMLGLIFVWMALMFFTFGTNGLRNGLACHIMLLAMSFFFDDKYIVGALLCLLAFGFHRSTMLPIAAMLAGRFVIKDMKYAIYIWVASIVISLAVGGMITNFLASLGFDDRMSSYNTTTYDDSFSQTGFRWDFLLYSSFPILMGWYVCVRKKIRDDWYRTLCVAYCLSNAFWVIVIRSAFSNRFAYLSWFMYPIVIAYPLVNLPVWRTQDRNTAVVLTLYSCFTVFMQVIYW